MDKDITAIMDIICEILDVKKDEVQMETYVIRDLGAESIDLLELAVTLADLFKIEISDEDIFLKSLRVYIEDARDRKISPDTLLAEKYPFLSRSRIRDILADLDEGPVLKVRDLLDYVQQKTA